MGGKTDSSPLSQVRKHYYLNQFVVIAPKRSKRPFTVSDKVKSGISVKKRYHEIEDDPAVYEQTDEKGQWLVKVVENLYPALSSNNPKAYGRQEIVLETHKEETLFSQLPQEQIARVLQTYQERVGVLIKDPKINHITIFKNHGFEAGASLGYTHSQIIAMDFVPPDVAIEAGVFEELYKRFGGSPLGAALEWEREEQVRIISTSLYVTAIAPFASRHPFEVWLIPHRHVGSVLDLSQKEIDAFALMLKRITGALDSRNISFNYFMHEGPSPSQQHFLIKIAPRPNIWAGYELDTGVMINSVSPEAAAAWYRKFIKRHHAG